MNIAKSRLVARVKEGRGRQHLDARLDADAGEALRDGLQHLAIAREPAIRPMDRHAEAVGVASLSEQRPRLRQIERDRCAVRDAADGDGRRELLGRAALACQADGPRCPHG
jgi:hypothetical protein